jgi:TRAP-type C4-dicarboxylate transport system permease small subunit
MARHVETETQWAAAARRLHRVRALPSKAAKRARGGLRVLTVLLVALVLAFIVWIPVELWGGRTRAEHDTVRGQSVVGAQPVQGSR